MMTPVKIEATISAETHPPRRVVKGPCRSFLRESRERMSTLVGIRLFGDAIKTTSKSLPNRLPDRTYQTTSPRRNRRGLGTSCHTSLEQTCIIFVRDGPYGLDVVNACLPALVGCADSRIAFFARRDLLGTEGEPIENLWVLDGARHILMKQLSSGAWRYPNPRAKELSPLQDYDQLETYRRLGQLVEQFGFDRSHGAIAAAAEFLFKRQTAEGDFRGIYGRQYTPNYSAGIAELLVKAGYGKDPRIGKAFRWLLSERQADGGWAIPFRTSNQKFMSRATHNAIRSLATLEPDHGKPSSAMITGVVLRAFAAHKDLGNSAEAHEAAELLPPRFFKRDTYIDRGAPEYWKRVTFPFWFTDIVSALDSLSLMRPPVRGKEVSAAVSWLRETRTRSGLFELRLLRTGDPALKYWESLAVCRVLKRYDADFS